MHANAVNSSSNCIHEKSHVSTFQNKFFFLNKKSLEKGFNLIIHSQNYVIISILFKTSINAAELSG